MKDMCMQFPQKKKQQQLHEILLRNTKTYIANMLIKIRNDKALQN